MLKPYQFPTKRKAKGTPKPAPAIKSGDIPSMNYPGTTKPEQMVYLALLQLGYKPEDISVQQSVFGGRDFPGGYVGDIIVYKPHPCFISVKGKYWHSNDEKEFIDDAFLSDKYPEYVVIWDYEIPTLDDAIRVVTFRVGKPL